MSKPTVHTAQEAINQIQEAMVHMDIDDLAQLLSQVVETNGPVIVVHDGNEGLTAEKVGADETIACSAVYENGENIGDLAEDGTIFGDDEEGEDDGD